MLSFERLKELKSWVSDLRKFGVSEGNEIIVLIDEAIARQSATSEEVAEAIGFIEGGFGDVWTWSKERREIILTALRQMRKPKNDVPNTIQDSIH